MLENFDNNLNSSEVTVEKKIITAKISKNEYKFKKSTTVGFPSKWKL